MGVVANNYVLVLTLATLTVGVWGSCNVPKKEFDPKRFMGKWVIHYFLAAEGAEPPMRCLVVDFEHKGDTKFHANLTGILTADGSFYADDGPMSLDNPDHPSLINVDWKGQKYTMAVVDSDYDNYAAANGCLFTAGHEALYSGIMTRTKDLPDDQLKKMQKSLTDVGTDLSKLGKIDQTNCG